MPRRNPPSSALAALAAALLMAGCATIEGKIAKAKEEKPGVRLEQLRAPAGHRVSLFARDIPAAREMARGAGNTLYVGSSEGKVYAVEMQGERAGTPRVILEGFRSSGISYADGTLYVADRDRIHRFDNVAAATPQTKGAVILTGLPDEKRHSARFMRIGPDGKLYISVGAPCDTCEAQNDEYGTIIRVNTDGSGREVVARGIRNTVGFDWHPRTRELWFTDNGPDGLGPDKPDDELNRVTKTGEHFGFPYCHNGNVPDPKFGPKRACSEFTAPAVGLGAHTAALGMRFVDAGLTVIARHGSHPPQRVAYDVVSVRIDNSGRASPMEPFLTGFLQGREYWGRPADVLPMADGSVLVSDDLNGVIYRVAKQ